MQNIHSQAIDFENTEKYFWKNTTNKLKNKNVRLEGWYQLQMLADTRNAKLRDKCVAKHE